MGAMLPTAAGRYVSTLPCPSSQILIAGYAFGRARNAATRFSPIVKDKRQAFGSQQQYLK
jgi:hypothetical protein